MHVSGHARAEELRTLLLLNENQITTLLAHRTANGDLLSVYELQTIDAFDPRTIELIRPFVHVASLLRAAGRSTCMARCCRSTGAECR